MRMLKGVIPGDCLWTSLRDEDREDTFTPNDLHTADLRELLLKTATRKALVCLEQFSLSQCSKPETKLTMSKIPWPIEHPKRHYEHGEH